MKKHALTLIVVLSLMVAAGSTLAQAQKITADVPFNFTVNQTNMPAGPYTISAMNNGTNVVLIQSDDYKAVKYVNLNRVESSAKADRTKLVFHCYGGDHCFLSQVWVRGASKGRELPASAAEKEIAAEQRSRTVAVLGGTR